MEIIMVMTMKYLVRPVENNCVCDSIFETTNLSEALKKVNQQYNENETRCIIVSCQENIMFTQRKK